MNPTIEKFGYPDTLVAELDHWVVLVRPAQVTLGSLVLAAKSDATAFSDLPADAFTELGTATAAIEHALGTRCDYDKINYLMLMMVDREVHFHVFPRYSEQRSWNGLDFPDAGWPKTPDLSSAIELTTDQQRQLAMELKRIFDHQL